MVVVSDVHCCQITITRLGEAITSRETEITNSTAATAIDVHAYNIFLLTCLASLISCDAS